MKMVLKSCGPRNSSTNFGSNASRSGLDWSVKGGFKMSGLWDDDEVPRSCRSQIYEDDHAFNPMTHSTSFGDMPHSVVSNAPTPAWVAEILRQSVESQAS